jgi:hypothetical protein
LSVLACSRWQCSQWSSAKAAAVGATFDGSAFVQIESKCDRRVNPAAMPRLHETEKWAKVIKFAGIGT